MAEQKQKNKQHQTWKELLKTSGKENPQYVGLATSRKCIAWYLILEVVLLDRKTFSGKRNVNRSSRTEAPAEASQVGLCILLVLDAHGHALFWFGLLFRKVWGIIDLRWRQTGCTMDWIQLNSAAGSCAEWVVECHVYRTWPRAAGAGWLLLALEHWFRLFTRERWELQYRAAELQASLTILFSKLSANPCWFLFLDLNCAVVFVGLYGSMVRMQICSDVNAGCWEHFKQYIVILVQSKWSWKL